MKKYHWREDCHKITFDEFLKQHKGFFKSDKEAAEKFKELGGKIKEKNTKEGDE